MSLRSKAQRFLFIVVAGILYGGPSAFADGGCSKYLEFTEGFFSQLRDGRVDEIVAGQSNSGYSFMVKASHVADDPEFRVVGIKDLGLTAEQYRARIDEDAAEAAAVQGGRPADPNRITTLQWLESTEGLFDKVIADFRTRYGVPVSDEGLAHLTDAVVLLRGHAVMIREIRLSADQVDAKLLATLFERLEKI